MPAALFRVEIPGRGPTLARGEPGSGPRELLPAELSLDGLLAGAAAGLGSALADAPAAGPVPAGAAVLPPVQSQEIWAAGLTYRRSRDARMEEAAEATPYDLAYAAERPFSISLEIGRGGGMVFRGETSTGQMHRGLADLARWLVSALRFPAGAVLLTGTGIVPGTQFTLSPGDVVRISIGPLGTLENLVELLRTGLVTPAEETSAPAASGPAEGASAPSASGPAEGASAPAASGPAGG